MANSNDNGRALEYALVDYIRKNRENVFLTTNALQMQKRDSIKFEQLPKDLKSNFLLASKKFLNWFESFKVDNRTINIDRFTDNSGVVYDFSINNLNFSIKHNHYALKHPRPYSLAQQCGFEKGCIEDNIHRKKMQAVSNGYRDALNGITKYSENQDLLYQLYSDVNQECMRSLNRWLKIDPKTAFKFFNFIVGTNFYKVIVKHSTTGPIVEVQDFLCVPQPDSFVCKTDPTRKNYLTVIFDHDWIIDLRVHSAATKIQLDNTKQLSLKYDAKKISGTTKSFQI